MIEGSDTIINKSKLISRRMFFLLSIKIFVFIAIVSRLFYLQISENIKYRSLSDKNRLREWKITPQRGIIEDYFGEKIANNTQVFQLHMIPEDVENLETLLFRLSKIINFDEAKKTNLLKRIKKRKPWEPIIISDNLTWQEFSKLNVFLHEVNGLKPVVAVARKYEDEEASSHVIGYVSDVSIRDLEKYDFLKKVNVPGLKIGKYGLEKALNEKIIGSPGFQRFEVNAYGKRVRELSFTKGTEGKSFKTTIDRDIQKFVSQTLQDKSASVCVMDIYTGDIISMVSSPSFDPNKFVHGIDKKSWNSLLSDKKKPLINKCISGTYPPGSTIKPIVALSALENDVVSPKFVVQCKGEIEFYGIKYRCWKEKGHGYMNLREGIKQSCDVFFYETARRLGIDRISITARQFGLGTKTLENFSEERIGVVPNTKWKLNKLGKGWVIGETLICGIGQGYFSSTPIQLCLMTAQLANGGYSIKPRIIDDKYALQPIINKWRKIFTTQNKNISNEQYDIQFDESEQSKYLEKLYRNQENVKFVLDALYGATNEPMGTSYRSRHVKKDYIYAGKTGTSQIRTITEEERELKLKNEDLPYEKRDHALFTAFAPYKNPRYALSIVVEHGGAGSSGAAPIAKKIIKLLLDRHELRKKYQLDLYQTEA